MPDSPPATTNLSVLRRQNLLLLLQDYAERVVASGTPTKGIDQAFAAAIGVSPSMLSQMKAGRPIGNKTAAQIETLCKRATGWLDTAHPEAKASPGEEAFVAMARDAWRAQNAKGKRALAKAMRDFGKA